MKDLLRALLVATVVGTALSLVHCRKLFGARGIYAFCDWHVYTCYLVPFAVSMVSARMARSRRS
ncbi:MAG: hypothetical protein HY698_18475 [Deltaproteobacteria bacterium]|nr:hypothetical protein [Deltaproteobacteria bacterium]